MEQEVLKPENSPRTRSQNLGPMGGLMAATGVTLMTASMLGAAMAITIWAVSKLMGLPDSIMLGLLAVGMIPVALATVWTAGRAWHVEKRLEQGLDIDNPVFKALHYFRR